MKLFPFRAGKRSKSLQRNRHDEQFSRDRVSSRSNHVWYPDHDGLLHEGLHAYGRRATDQDGLLREGPRAYGHDANNRFLREGPSAYGYHANNRAVFREGADPYGYHVNNRAIFPEAPRGYDYNASDRDNPFRSGHRAYDYNADDQNNHTRNGYYAHDYRSNEQDAYHNSYKIDDYRSRNNDERSRDEMRQASRNEPEGIPRRNEARPLNNRNDGKRPQPSKQPAKPHHDPSKIDRYIPERPNQNRKTEPSSVNVQSASNQPPQNPGDTSQNRKNVQRRKEDIMRDIFRV